MVFRSAIGSTPNDFTNTTTPFIIRLRFLNVPLPVELTSFAASVNLNNVNLNWKTATEVNNNGFEVQREIRESGVRGQ